MYALDFRNTGNYLGSPLRFQLFHAPLSINIHFWLYCLKSNSRRMEIRYCMITHYHVSSYIEFFFSSSTKGLIEFLIPSSSKLSSN